MADNDTSIFGDIYEYVQDGTISRIPDISELRTKVADGFKRIFGDDFSVAPETPGGILIDEMTLFLFDCLGVCVQNVNGMNLSLALGKQLDVVGGVLGVDRNQGESDMDYRTRISESIGVGSNGTVRGVRNAIGKLPSVKAFCVLENNRGYAMALPEGRPNAIVVQPHSLFICVSFNGTATQDAILEVANTIADSKAPGCGYTSNSGGSVQDVTIDGPGGATEKVVFTVASIFPIISINVTMNANTYQGSDMESDVSGAVTRYILSNPISAVITKTDLVSAIAAAGFGTATDIQIYVDGEEEESIVIMPYQATNEDSIVVNVS